MSLEDEVNFSLKLLSLLDAANSSTIFSPASILNSLAMIHSGAKGKTAEEIASIIDESPVKNENRKRPHSTETRNVNVANGFFVSDNIKLVQSYEKLVKDKFNGKIRSLDFKKPVQAVKEINTFVSDSTNKAIKKIINSEDISLQTSLVLINAIHFIGFWEEPFGNRKKLTFNSNPSREIPMMTKELKGGKEEWNFQRGEGWKCLGIPYKNRKAWLYIVLPEAIDGLSALIKKLDYLLIEKCTERRKTFKMEIIIPIIQNSSSINLETKLKELGITEIFSDKANLSGMLGRPNKIEKAIHKAVIKVIKKSFKM
uniref:Serpin domain-containing protein n=1 Tax=Panagrolaimus davidi TaxID=227884 RepID=A0A914QZ63_9BILA